jgi:hypothetical protein
MNAIAQHIFLHIKTKIIVSAAVTFFILSQNNI